MTPLGGLTVVVTRPAAQASGFASLLEAAGAKPLLLPALVIEPITLAPDTIARLSRDPCDWAIYTSANSVEYSLARLPPPRGAGIAAIGRGTARALGKHGLRVDAVPESRPDSEGLLALPSFTDVRGRRILIVKGEGGRPYLREELLRRGAEVLDAEVYRRRDATATPQALHALADACRRAGTVVAITSAEGLAALLRLAPETRVPGLRDAIVLVPGERVAAAAGALGWRGPVLVAQGAEDAAMVRCLEQALAREGPHGSP